MNKTHRHDHMAPLVVSPDTAAMMLDESVVEVHRDIAAGLLESYLQGRRRKITVRSIEALVAKRVAGADPTARRVESYAASAAADEKRRRKRDQAVDTENVNQQSAGS